MNTIENSLAAKVIEVAKTQIGLEEIPKGSNWGVNVKKYLASVGIDFPASWCMAFVYFCVSEACKANGSKNSLVKTGGVLNQWSNVNSALKVKTPQPGDIFNMDFGGGHGHTGFVEKVEGDRIQTIEGNSNADGSREGYEVCRKPGGRPISSIKGFIRVAA